MESELSLNQRRSIRRHDISHRRRPMFIYRHAEIIGDHLIEILFRRRLSSIFPVIRYRTTTHVYVNIHLPAQKKKRKNKEETENDKSYYDVLLLY